MDKENRTFINLFTPGPVDPAMRNRLSDGHPDDFLLINCYCDHSRLFQDQVLPGGADGRGLDLLVARIPADGLLGLTGGQPP